MAYDVNKLTKLEALKATAERIAQDFATKAELSATSADATAAIKSGKVDGNTVSLYTSKDKTGTAAFTFDFPTEMFLDQSKTVFVDSFAWTEADYPVSTNPNLDGKPVMVLAVKGDDNSVTYSFLSMAKLVDTYKAKVTNKDNSTTITVEGYEIDVKVNISAEADNQIQVKADGLYVAKPAKVDISGKADKVAGATNGNFAALDADGNITDSGKKAADFVEAEDGKGLSANNYTDAEKAKLAGIAEDATKFETTEKAGVVKVNGAEKTLFEVSTDEEVAEMLDEVFGVTE